MERAGEAEQIARITAGKIRRILEIRDDSQRKSAESRQKAVLAGLRRGAGRAPGELPELWGEFLGSLPDNLYGAEKDGPGQAEWAVYTALTLFALHQQGHDPAQQTEWMHTEGVSLGAAAARTALSADGDERQTAFDRVRRRFNIAATADSMDKLSWHLRGLVQLMSGKSVGMDYGRLARDLYWYQFPAARNNVRLQWGRDLYGEFYRAVHGERKDDTDG